LELNMQNIKLDLNINELNSILNALGAMPYVQVVALIDKLKVQVTPQIQEKPDHNDDDHVR